MTGDDPRERFEEIRSRIEHDQDTPEERLAFAYGIISQLLDDVAWQRAIVDDQVVSLVALRGELESARSKLDMLQKTGKGTRRRIGSVIAGVLGTLVLISQISGYTVKDLVAPDSPAAPLVVVVDHDDLQRLGIEAPAVIQSAGVASVLVRAAAATVTVASPIIPPGKAMDVNGVTFTNNSGGDLVASVSSVHIPDGHWLEARERAIFDIPEEPTENVTVENLRPDQERVSIYLAVLGRGDLVRGPG
jgi:hypothetical protein